MRGLTEHFDTAEGYPQSKSEVHLATDSELSDFMGMCAVEPADFDNCLACYAYEVIQEREKIKKDMAWKNASTDAIIAELNTRSRYDVVSQAAAKRLRILEVEIKVLREEVQILREAAGGLHG